MKTTAMGIVILASLGGGSSSSRNPENEAPPTLWLFFDAETSGAPGAARQAVDFVLKKSGDVRLRPVLLVSDWKKLTHLSKKTPLVGVLEELKRLGQKELNVPLYDVEGLRLAGHLELSRLPAFVLVAEGRAHVAIGDRVDLGRLYGASR